MIDFDLRTALVKLGLLYLIMPTIAWVVLAKQRSLPVALWCAGGLMFGFVGILAGLQGKLPEWAFTYLSALLLFAGNFARIQSLRLELGIPWQTRWIALALLVSMLLLHTIYYGLGDVVLRAQFITLVGVIQILLIAALAGRIGREEQSLSAKWIAWVYLLMATALIYRFVTLIDFKGEAGLVYEGTSTLVIVGVGMLAAVMGHLGYVGLHLDRSMRRELKTAADLARDEENRRLGEQIAQLDRQRTLGEMSASLAHELNQPLTAILTNAQVARRGLHSGHFNTQQHGEFLDKIIQSTQRASQIIERIRGFIRPSASSTEPVYLNRIVQEVAELVADEARSHKVSFVFCPNAAKPQVNGDTIQISQIVLNAFRNAIEALKQVVRREIQVSCLHADGRAILRIRDTGPGLTPEALTLAGKPFFTTKPNGLGIGLSISCSIAAQHGGTLSITNADGGGTLLELNLPALHEEPT